MRSLPVVDLLAASNPGAGRSEIVVVLEIRLDYSGASTKTAAVAAAAADGVLAA